MLIIFYRTFGTNISLRKRNQMRLLQAFESKESAKLRTIEEKTKVNLVRENNT